MTEEQRNQDVVTATGESPFSPIEEAIEEIRRGRMVVVCDGEDRENEGDLVMAAQFATADKIAFMAREARGLICLSLPPALERRLYLVSTIGVIGVLELGIVAFCLRCEDVLQLPFGNFLYGDLSPISGGTRFGKAFVAMTLGFALVAALIYLAWLVERPMLLAPGLVLGLGLVSGLSVSGHDGVDPGSSWKSAVADWVHLSAATLWIGGLVSLVVVWPVAAALRGEVFWRFSRLAGWLVALVLGAGTYLAIVRLPHFHDLWTQGYGQVLLVKISLVAVVLAWGAVHRFVVRPSLAGAGDGFMARVGRSVAGESLVGLAVLLAAAILVDSKPPPRPAPGPVAQAARR